MDTKIVKIEDGKNTNRYGQEVIACENNCGRLTTMTGTGLCDFCWEKNRRSYTPMNRKQIIGKICRFRAMRDRSKRDSETHNLFDPDYSFLRGWSKGNAIAWHLAAHSLFRELKDINQ